MEVEALAAVAAAGASVADAEEEASAAVVASPCLEAESAEHCSTVMRSVVPSGPHHSTPLHGWPYSNFRSIKTRENYRYRC